MKTQTAEQISNEYKLLAISKLKRYIASGLRTEFTDYMKYLRMMERWADIHLLITNCLNPYQEPWGINFLGEEQ